MIQIRNNTFETNSSSVHMLVIPKECSLHIPHSVHLTGGEWGWEFGSVTDTINYIYQACCDRGEEEERKFVRYLNGKGIVVESRAEINEDGWYDGYIDHGGEIPLEEFFHNSAMLDRFLFGGGWVDTGNDNSDDYPTEEDYDPDKYDVIGKYN